jgi:hypothetical protein
MHLTLSKFHQNQEGGCIRKPCSLLPETGSLCGQQQPVFNEGMYAQSRQGSLLKLASLLRVEPVGATGKNLVFILTIL